MNPALEGGRWDKNYRVTDEAGEMCAQRSTIIIEAYLLEHSKAEFHVLLATTWQDDRSRRTRRDVTSDGEF